MLCVYLITPPMDVHPKHGLLWWETEEQRAIFKLATKVKKELIFFLPEVTPATVVTNVIQISEVGSGFWRIPQVMYCLRSAYIGLHAIPWKLLSLSLFPCGAGRKNTCMDLLSFLKKTWRNFQTWFFQAGGDSLEWWLLSFFRRIQGLGFYVWLRY